MPPQQTNHPFFESQNVLPKSKSSLSLKLGKTSSFHLIRTATSTIAITHYNHGQPQHQACREARKLRGTRVSRRSSHLQHRRKCRRHVHGRLFRHCLPLRHGILPMLRHVLRVPKNSSLRKEDETETKPDFRLASISTYAIPFGRLLKQRFHAPHSKPTNDPRGQRGTRDQA
jgi:hypothetical protein